MSAINSSKVRHFAFKAAHRAAASVTYSAPGHVRSRWPRADRVTTHSHPWCAGKSGRQLVNDRLEALLHSDSGSRTDLGRHSLVGSALRLSYFTIVWNGVVGAAALGVGLTTAASPWPGSP